MHHCEVFLLFFFFGDHQLSSSSLAAQSKHPGRNSSPPCTPPLSNLMPLYGRNAVFNVGQTHLDEVSTRVSHTRDAASDETPSKVQKILR